MMANRLNVTNRVAPADQGSRVYYRAPCLGIAKRGASACLRKLQKSEASATMGAAEDGFWRAIDHSYHASVGKTRESNPSPFILGQRQRIMPILNQIS